MKATNAKLLKALQIATVSLLTIAATQAQAGVKFRLAYNATTNVYAVYMKPDTAPTPDLLVSAQITLVAPHTATFQIANLNSTVTNANWLQHSRVNAPLENTAADYLSIGYFAGGTVPKFNWVANTEKKVLTFTSPQGCVAGLKLMDNADPFNQLPNSVNTNPGNEITNYGWGFSNAYTANYGTAVTCPTTLLPLM